MRKFSNDLLKAILIILVISMVYLIMAVVFAPECECIEIEKNDRWYYETEVNFSPMIIGTPDKFEHFYRSYAMSRAIPIELVITFSLLYELNDDRRGVYFSVKDLIADTIGAIAGKLYGRDFQILLDWNRNEKYLMLTLCYGV